MEDKVLRDHLLKQLGHSQAHVDFDKAVANLPTQLRGTRPTDLPYSPWEVIEHIRIAQWDIVEFCVNPDHESPDWPDGYWPESQGPENDKAWQASLASYRADLKRMTELVSNPKTDLAARIPHGDGQTILREALLIIDHAAYHVGQLIVIRRLLNAWKDS